jgi:hypothetical protein
MEVSGREGMAEKIGNDENGLVFVTRVRARQRMNLVQQFKSCNGSEAVDCGSTVQFKISGS